MTDAAARDATIAPLVGTLPPHCEKDLGALRRFVRAAISQGAPADPVSPGDFREVLLSGATGFVGRFRPARPPAATTRVWWCHCVVRASDAVHGFERLRQALLHAEIWDEAFVPRIRVVVGDVAEGPIRPERGGVSRPSVGSWTLSIMSRPTSASPRPMSPYAKVNTFSIRQRAGVELACAPASMSSSPRP